MTNRHSIGPDSLVDDVLRQFPTVARVFIDRRMHCVGCEVSRFESLASASRVYGLPLDALLADIRAAAAGASASLRQRKDPPPAAA